MCVCVCVRALFPGDLCAADGAYVVSFNDGGPSPGEARRRSILCSVYAQSAHQRDTNVGQRKGNAADSSHSREQGERRRKKKKRNAQKRLPWAKYQSGWIKAALVWKSITFRSETESDTQRQCNSELRGNSTYCSCTLMFCFSVLLCRRGFHQCKWAQSKFNKSRWLHF